MVAENLFHAGASSAGGLRESEAGRRSGRRDNIGGSRRAMTKENIRWVSTTNAAAVTETRRLGTGRDRSDDLPP